MATQADLDAINAAIAALIAGQRVTEVRFSDRTVKYAEVSLNQLQAERERIQQAIAPASRVRPLRYEGL